MPRDIELLKDPGVRHRIRMNWLREHLLAVAKELQQPISRVSVALIDDRQMTSLHRKHLGVRSTTDVLTFPASNPGEPVDADIAIGVEVAKRHAATLGHPIEREILLYIVHGLLHCCGYDDHSKAGFAKMHAEEDRILKAIGVGSTFAKAPARRVRRRRRPRSAR